MPVIKICLQTKAIKTTSCSKMIYRIVKNDSDRSLFFWARDQMSYA